MEKVFEYLVMASGAGGAAARTALGHG